MPLPDANTRQEILEMQLHNMPVASDVNIDELVNRTESYSGAEVGFVTVRYRKLFLIGVRM